MQAIEKMCVMVIDFSDVAQSCNIYNEFISKMQARRQVSYNTLESPFTEAINNLDNTMKTTEFRCLMTTV